ncbi:putative ribonuclease H-like domain-containing protein [Tanacetum coccineum]
MSQPANDEFSQHLSDDEESNHEDASDTGAAPKQQQQVIPQTTAISNIKLPILKKEEYDIWAMEMEHYLEYIDNEVWKVIQNGNSKKRISTGKDGIVRILSPVTAAEIQAVEKERKAKNILLMAIPKEHMRRFHGMDDAKEIWEAIRTRSLPPAWSNLAMTMRTSPEIDNLSIDDLYNNLRVFEQEIQGASKTSSSAQNVAFVSQSKSSTNKVKSGFTESNLIPFLPNKSILDLLHEDLEQIDDVDIEEMDINWQIAMIAIRMKKFYKKTGRRVRWKTSKGEPLCSKTCIDSYNTLKTLCDEQMNQLGDQEAQILAYSQAVKKLEAQLVTFQKQQLSLNEKLTFQANEIYEKDEKLKRYRRIGMKAVKEKEQLQKTLDSWKDSSKNLWRLINSDMSSNSKVGLGFEKQSNNEVLSVPHPLSRDYTPKPQEEIDDSLYVYGKKGPQKPEISDSDDNSTEHSTCQSNDSEGSCGNTSEHSSESESESISVPNEMSTSRSVQLNAGRPNTNSVRPRVNAVSSNVNTVRSRQLVPTKTSNSFCSKRPQMNQFNQRRDFSKSHSSVRRPFATTTAQMSHSNAVKGNWGSAEHPLKNMVDRGIFDSGCSGHMTGNKDQLEDFEEFNGGSVTFGGSKGYISGKGKIRVGNLDFDSVSFVKELGHFNLFSISQICDKQHKVLFTETECLVVSSDFKMPDENQILLKVPRHHNMYSFDMKTPTPAKGFACLIAKATSDESKLWHRRLGHINFKNLNKLVKGNLVRGLPSKVFKNDHTCVACHKGKQHRASCKAKLERLITEPLHTLHMDLFGPTSVKSINHASYCLVITDDCTRFSWVFFLASKDETSGILQTFIRQIENQLSHRVKIIRSDNGTEFKNRDMLEFCGNKGIKQEYSNARTPQQNGVAERMNRTLIEAARTMLADSLLPTTFWAEAVSTACYIFNRVRVTKPQNKTPYELLFGHKPIISYIRPFGCHVTILDTLSVLGKFDGKSDEGFLVGYSLNSKAYRVYNLVTKRVEVNLHVNFLEDKPNVKGVGYRWMFDIDYLTDSMNYIPVSLENQANPHAGASEVTNSAGTPTSIASEEKDEEVELIVVPSAVKIPEEKDESRTSSTNSKKEETLTEPQKEKKDSSTDSLEDNPKIQAFRRELEEIALKHLGTVPENNSTSTPSVNTGSQTVNTGRLDHDDSSMPELEIFHKSETGIFDEASYDEDGVITDFNSLPIEIEDETSGILQTFIRQIENQLSHRVKIIRSDNGTEFKNRDMLEFCGNKGIKQEYSNARTPQQNGVAERMNRTLIEAARTMLADSLLPTTFWAEAVSTACYIFNRVRVTKPQNKTPYELLFGHKPIISYIRPFGCHVTILDTLSVLGKFDGKSDEGFLVGYSLNSKAYRVYNLVTKRVEVNLHVNFLEDKPNVKGVGYRWMFDIDYLTDSMNYIPVSLENQANPHAGTSEKTNNAGTSQTPNSNASEEKDEDVELIVVPSAVPIPEEIVDSRTSSTKSKKEKILTDPQQEEKVSSTDTLEDNPKIQAFRRELEQIALKHLGTVPENNSTSTPSVNTGSQTVNTGRLDHDDSLMPELEIFHKPETGIFDEASYDEEGVITDFNSLPTEIEVSPTPTLRIHSIHPKSQILDDPKSAVQTRSKVQNKIGAHALLSHIQKQQRNNHKDQQHCLFACFLSQEEPKKIAEALQDDSWVQVMQEELLQFKLQQVWILVDLPHGMKVIGTKWVYRNKRDERGVVVRNKARLVAQGHNMDVQMKGRRFHSILQYGCNRVLFLHSMDVQMKGRSDKEINRHGMRERDALGTFWIATLKDLGLVPTSADGTLAINATIDTIGYTITEASIRDTLQLDDATGIKLLPNAENFEGDGGKMGQENDDVAQTQPSSSTPPVPSTSSPPVQSQPPIPTPNPATIPTPTPIPKTEPEPFEHTFEEPSPVHQHFSPPQEQAQGQMAMDDLLQVVPQLISRIDSLETNLKQTKLTMGNAIVKLVKKVKKLEGLLKKRNVVLSDSEEEELEAQGRKSQDDPLDNRCLIYTSINIHTTPVTTSHSTTHAQIVSLAIENINQAET